MVKRYPHSIKITYNDGTFDNGVFEPGNDVEITTKCRIEHAEVGNQYKVKSSGDTINHTWIVFCPLFDGSETVPEPAQVISNSNDNPVAFKAKEHVVLSFTVYQKHIEVKV